MQVFDPIKENLKLFQKAYLHDFGILLSDKDAYEALFNLVGLFKSLEKIDAKIQRDKRLANLEFENSNKNASIKLDTTNKHSSADYLGEQKI